ncbi:hypothetical protein ACHAXS_009161, partial [Conticribra weissflogii]
MYPSKLTRRSPTHPETRSHSALSTTFSAALCSESLNCRTSGSSSTSPHPSTATVLPPPGWAAFLLRATVGMFLTTDGEVVGVGAGGV